MMPVTCPTLEYFFTFLKNGTTLKKKFDQKICFDYLYKFAWNISYSKKNWARCVHKSNYIFMKISSFHCQILMRLEQFRRIWLKYPDIRCHENLFIGSRVVLCGQTADRQRERERDRRRTDMTKLMVAFCKFVNPPKSFNTMHEEKFKTMKFLHILLRKFYWRG